MDLFLIIPFPEVIPFLRVILRLWYRSSSSLPGPVSLQLKFGMEAKKQ